MKRLLQIAVPVILGMVVLFSGCEKDDKVNTVDVTVEVKVPDGLSSALTPEGLTLTITNKATGVATDYTVNAQGNVRQTLEEGVYNFQVSGKKEYAYEDYDGQHNKTATFSGLAENISVASSTAGTATVSVRISESVESKGWIIKEIYFSGTRTSDGKAYSKDQYVVIYNNTDQAMYADGLCIAETKGISTSEVNYWEDEKEQGVFVQTIYAIPGDGQTYRIEPGQGFMIAPQPINHAKETGDAKMLDLSGADFQWYDEYTGLSVDVPEVPNLIKHFSYSNTVWIASIQCNRAFVLFQTGEDMAQYITNHTDFRKTTGTKDVESIKLGNSLILDAVELGIPDKMKVKNLSVSLDLGSTYWNGGSVFEGIRRKVDHEKDGRIIYQDTNNSSVDFEIVTPSGK